MVDRDNAPRAALAGLLALWALFVALSARSGGRPAGGGPPGPRPLLPDLNRSPANHLLLLPRIGPKKARAIVEGRVCGGPFPDLEHLERVRGIGPRTVAGLRGRVRVTAGGR